MFFTHRMCCCSAAVASQVVAVIAFIIVVGQATIYWIYGAGHMLALAIYQTVLAFFELVSCVLVFAACRKTRPVLLLPMMVLQALNCLNLIGICVYSLIGMAGNGDAGTYAMLIGSYLVCFLIGLFFLHCHICCYRLLVSRRIAHNNHDGYDNKDSVITICAVKRKRKTDEDAFARMIFPLLLIAVFTTVGADYDDNLARNIIFPLASAAYGQKDATQQCLDKHLPGAKLSVRAEISCDSIAVDLCVGYTFIDEQSKSIGLVFKGTDTEKQLSAEVHSVLQDPAVPFKDGGMVGPYFNTAFEDLWADGGLGADLQRLSKAHPDYTLYITGHSLGASMSALVATRVAKTKIHPVEKIIMYNFGEPRTGDKTFANQFDSLLKGYRVIHDKDLIPHTPFPSMGYQHHATEVFYENDMSPGSPYVVCKGQEDPKCSNKYKFDLNFADDHFHYFNVHVVNYGSSGCTKTT